MSKIKNRDNISRRITNFLATNLWLIWIVVLLNTVWNISLSMNLNRVSDEVSVEIHKVIKQLKSGVIMMDVLGRPIASKPQVVSATNISFKRAVLNYIKLYGIYDWSILTGNFQKDIFSVEDAYKRNERVRIFVDNFFADKGNPAAQDFFAYLQQSIFSMNQNKLPEKTTIIDEEISSFTVKEGVFTARFTLKMSVSSFDGNTNKYKIEEGFVIIDAIGTINPAEGTPDNLLGIKFTEKYKPTILKKNL